MCANKITKLLDRADSEQSRLKKLDKKYEKPLVVRKVINDGMSRVIGAWYMLDNQPWRLHSRIDDNYTVVNADGLFREVCAYNKMFRNRIW